MTQTNRQAGSLLREWRVARRMSQLELALRSEISTRHLSFIETGRSTPGRAVLLDLAEQLDMPLRERNQALLLAGYAPAFSDRSLEDPDHRPFRDMLTKLLKGHEPFPAIAVDRYWTLVAANGPAHRLFLACAPHLLVPPINVLRVTLHPEGLAPSIVNIDDWHALMLSRLRQQLRQTPDRRLQSILDELSNFRNLDRGRQRVETSTLDHVIPISIRTASGILNLIGVSMVLGSPWDVTISEIAIEAFLPADEATTALIGRL